MKPEICNQCSSHNILVGRAETQHGRRIFPHYCGDCGAVFSTMQATRAEVAAFEAVHGRPERVYTSTEQKMNRGEGVWQRVPHGKPCEVCCATENVEVHHWAPAHLFGPECNKWPIAYLCRPCHLKWHKLVTPGMAKTKGAYRQHFDVVRKDRNP